MKNLLLGILLVLFITSCSTHRQVINKYEGATAQELMGCSIMHSIDSLADKIKSKEISNVKINTTFIDNSIPQKEFIVNYIRTKFKSLYIETNDDMTNELYLFISTSATDYSKSSLGIPSMPIPFTQTQTPNIDLLRLDKFQSIFIVKYFLFQNNQFIESDEIYNICYNNDMQIIIIPVNIKNQNEIK